MARVSTYLNFARSTEEAFNFYRSVFGTEFLGPIMRFSDIPTQPGQPALAETDRLFAALGQGGKADMPLQEMFWGDYFGILVDQFGIRWMFNCSSKA